MKIDIVTRDNFELYHEEIRLILKDLRSQFHSLKALVLQLQDRIKMMEVKQNESN